MRAIACSTVSTSEGCAFAIIVMSDGSLWQMDMVDGAWQFTEIALPSRE